MDEDERLDDLAELGADRSGCFGGRMGRLVEHVDLEADALPARGVKDALDGGIGDQFGHGRKSSIRVARRRSGTIRRWPSER